MPKKQFFLFLLIAAYVLHLGHQLFPHHHHTDELVAVHQHEPNSNHHHNSSDFPEQEKKGTWLNELLSFINHGNTDSPIQSSNQLKTDFSKTFPIILPGFNRLENFTLPEYTLILPVYFPNEDKPTKYIILFKNRRGPPVMV